MRFRQERLYNNSVESIVNLFMEGDDPVYDMDSLENVTQWKVIKEEDVGDKRIGTKEWCAHAQIPKALQHIVSPKMLTWYEHSEWDRKARTYRFRIEPFYLKKSVKCHGQTTYKESGANQCVRVFEINLIVDIPIFGPMFEKVVLDLLKRNEEQDFRLTTKIAKQQLS
jgi:hypothetical protein